MTKLVTSSLHVNRITSGIILAVLAGISFATAGFFANKLVDEGSPGIVVGFYESVFGLIFVLAINTRRLRARPKITRSSLKWINSADLGFTIA